MKKTKKVTYTLENRVIKIITNNCFIDSISMSKFVSQCIQSGYEMMMDGYHENNKQPLVGIIRKRKNTIPKTFTLPIEVEKILSWFSEKLAVKKSHLVMCCVLYFEREDLKQLSQQIDELMQSVEE